MYAQRKPRGGFDAIADVIYSELKARGISKQQLAKRTGLHREQISLWLNGKRPLRVDYLVPILDELGLEILPVTLKRHVVNLDRPAATPKAKVRRRASAE